MIRSLSVISASGSGDRATPKHKRNSNRENSNRENSKSAAKERTSASSRLKQEKQPQAVTTEPGSPRPFLAAMNS
jgi:hypothetical protein